MTTHNKQSNNLFQTRGLSVYKPTHNQSRQFSRTHVEDITHVQLYMLSIEVSESSRPLFVCYKLVRDIFKSVGRVSASFLLTSPQGVGPEQRLKSIPMVDAGDDWRLGSMYPPLKTAVFTRLSEREPLREDRYICLPTPTNTASRAELALLALAINSPVRMEDVFGVSPAFDGSTPESLRTSSLATYTDDNDPFAQRWKWTWETPGLQRRFHTTVITPLTAYLWWVSTSLWEVITPTLKKIIHRISDRSIQSNAGDSWYTRDQRMQQMMREPSRFARIEEIITLLSQRWSTPYLSKNLGVRSTLSWSASVFDRLLRVWKIFSETYIFTEGFCPNNEKNVFIVGPHQCGKTWLAQGLAHSSKAPIYETTCRPFKMSDTPDFWFRGRRIAANSPKYRIRHKDRRWLFYSMFRFRSITTIRGQVLQWLKANRVPESVSLERTNDWLASIYATNYRSRRPTDPWFVWIRHVLSRTVVNRCRLAGSFVSHFLRTWSTRALYQLVYLLSAHTLFLRAPAGRLRPYTIWERFATTQKVTHSYSKFAFGFSLLPTYGPTPYVLIIENFEDLQDERTKERSTFSPSAMDTDVQQLSRENGLMYDTSLYYGVTGPGVLLESKHRNHAQAPYATQDADAHAWPTHSLSARDADAYNAYEFWSTFLPPSRPRQPLVNSRRQPFQTSQRQTVYSREKSFASRMYPQALSRETIESDRVTVNTFLAAIQSRTTGCCIITSTEMPADKVLYDAQVGRVITLDYPSLDNRVAAVTESPLYTNFLRACAREEKWMPSVEAMEGFTYSSIFLACTYAVNLALMEANTRSQGTTIHESEDEKDDRLCDYLAQGVKAITWEHRKRQVTLEWANDQQHNLWDLV